MGRSERVALGRFVLRSKEYLVAVRVRDGLLALTTMLFADEVRPVKGINNGGSKPAAKALAEAVKLIDALTVEWDPSQYHDEHRKRLQEIVKKKSKGATIEAPEQDKAPAPADDLMEALRKTLEEMGGGGGKAKRSRSRTRSSSSSSGARGGRRKRKTSSRR
jgi:DNA end-binding protein Ku